jgi:hypothetical protein
MLAIVLLLTFGAGYVVAMIVGYVRFGPNERVVVFQIPDDMTRSEFLEATGSGLARPRLSEWSHALVNVKLELDSKSFDGEAEICHTQAREGEEATLPDSWPYIVVNHQERWTASQRSYKVSPGSNWIWAKALINGVPYRSQPVRIDVQWGKTSMDVTFELVEKPGLRARAIGADTQPRDSYGIVCSPWPRSSSPAGASVELCYGVFTDSRGSWEVFEVVIGSRYELWAMEVPMVVGKNYPYNNEVVTVESNLTEVSVKVRESE